jgi:hypothetical protein
MYPPYWSSLALLYSYWFKQFLRSFLLVLLPMPRVRVVLICLDAALLIPTTFSAALLLLAQTVLCILLIGPFSAALLLLVETVLCILLIGHLTYTYLK